MQGKLKNSKGAAVDPHEIAVRVLGWLAGDPDMLGRFLALTGVEPGQLRNVVDDPGFLGGMLDFVMAHEPSLMAFCEATGTPPEAVMTASAYYTSPGLGSGEY